MSQTQLQTFGKPPLPKGYSPHHVITKRKCGRKFLLAYIFKAKGKQMPQLVMGSGVHTDISNGIFESTDPARQQLLNTAYNFLSKMPPDPTFETDFHDKNNPGVYKGTIFGLPFMAIFDVHWIVARIGIDWKLGTLKEDKTDYEIQAYILNELFLQTHKHNLRQLFFVSLKTGEVYEAQSIHNGPVRVRTEKKIKTALESIKRLEFEKKVSWACQWCEYQGMCI